MHWLESDRDALPRRSQDDDITQAIAGPLADGTIARTRVDHEKRIGGPYGPKSKLSEEAKRLRSERMKEYNRKTGKGTALGNSRARRGGKPK